jgi:excinuclease ABC subunit A
MRTASAIRTTSSTSAPAPGAHGGNVVLAGKTSDLLAGRAAEVRSDFQSTTLKYLTNELTIHAPTERRTIDLDKACLELKGCRENNLKNIDVRIPLGGLILITGVSGSGKSTLINQTLLPALKRKLYGSKVKPGEHKSLNGTKNIDKVIEIDQSPIGRTPRSNPRRTPACSTRSAKSSRKPAKAKSAAMRPGGFRSTSRAAAARRARARGPSASRCTFCRTCTSTAKVCHGARYNAETLEILYRGKNISDVLNMTVEEALGFFENMPRIHQMLKALNDVGLSYVKIGQPSTQLSGGEAQRVKLATELGKTATGHTLYVLDEPRPACTSPTSTTC